MAGRGRKPGYVMGESHRTKIRDSQILNRLLDHALGNNDMSATQIQAARILLSKVMPDLQSVALTDADHTGHAKIEIGWIKD